MPMARRNEKVSENTMHPINTPVTGSKAPMMADGVLPMLLIDTVMK